MRKKTKFRHSSKIKDDIDLIKIEVRDNQFLIEKNIGTVKKTIHTWLVWKKTPEIMLEIEKNYRLYRRVY